MQIRDTARIEQVLPRLQPQSVEAEEALLGSVLIDPNYLNEIETRPDDFYREKNGWIWNAILSLHNANEPVDFLTVCDYLSNNSQLDQVGGAAYITSLINAVPTSIHAEHYAHIVEEKATRRRIIHAATRAARAAYQEEMDIEQVHAAAEQAIMGVRSVSKNERTMSDILDESFKEIASPTQEMGDRIFTGLSPIDTGTFGIEAGRYWLAAAVSGTGKSVASINVMRLAPPGTGVLYLCPEQAPEEITYMALASGTQSVIPLRVKLLHIKPKFREMFAKADLGADERLRNAVYGSGTTLKDLTRDITPEEQHQLQMSRKQLDNKHIWPMSPGDMDIYALRRLFRRKRAELTRLEGPGAFLFIIVDGLGLIRKTDPGNTLGSLMEISQNVKIATGSDIAPGAIWVNHHFNRGIFGGNGTNRRNYNMGHLRDAPVENDADVIVCLDRDSVWDKQRKPAPLWEEMNFIYLKNRQTSKVFVASAAMNTSTLGMKNK